LGNLNSKLVLVASVLVAACGGSESGGSPETGGASGAAGTLASGNAGTNAGAGASGGSSNASGGSGSANAGSGNPSGGAGNPSGGSGTGGAGAHSCHAITACGGDVVGTWQVSDYCSEVLSAPDASGTCAGATVSISQPKVSGSVTFNADLTTLTTLSLSFSEQASFPASCYTQTQCDDFSAALKSEAQVSNAVCNYSASAGCGCTLDFGTTQTAVPGTYQIDGNTITTKSSTSTTTPEPDDYCVSGNTLTISTTNAQGQVSTITLTK